MAVHCAAAEHGGLIEKETKESLWVKLEAFPTKHSTINYNK